MMFAEATAQQLETQQLREMVAALCLEVAALKAAGTSVGEGRDNTGGDVEDAAQASGRRVRVIDSQGEWQPFVDAEEVDDQAQHFIGSPIADDQPEQAWQDPWRSQDPWTPDASRYPVPSWDHNATPDASRYPVPWWNHNAPLHTTPGMAASAPSEQWTERADAQDDWWSKGNSGWWRWNQWQDWSWPKGHYGWKSSGPKHSMDRKDIAKPECYNGDTSKWVPWSATFVRYLNRLDEQWPAILKRIEGLKGKMLSKEDEDQIDYDLDLGGLKTWKEDLLLALESFTSGETKQLILLSKAQGVFSSWSRLADKGFSQRDDHVMIMRRKVIAPKNSVPAKDLELAILAWERDILQFEETADETFDEKNRLLLLQDMLPPIIRQRIKDLRGPGRFDTYEAVRAEALIWLADNAPQKGKLALVAEVQDEELPDVAYEDLGDFCSNPANAETSQESLMAIVKNAHLKKQKGAGKGSGKDRPPRKCYECDSPDHIAANCLQRAARVAAGGPERLDDPMGLAGGKAKKKTGGK